MRLNRKIAKVILSTAVFVAVVFVHNQAYFASIGFFETQGIPSSMGLVSAYRNNQVSASDLIQIAVSMNRLPQSTLTDREYLNAVNSQLEDLAVVASLPARCSTPVVN